jgi:predicted nucleic acid-binding protein
MIFDTDILSVFGKIGKISLLKKIFKDSDITITFEVYNELLKAKDAGYDFVDDILEQGFKVIQLDQDLIIEFEQNKDKLKNIHSGELASILLCKKLNMDFATNDKKAKTFCEENRVVWYDIVDILRLCYLKHIMNERDLRDVIKEIEIRDRTYISKKERIFGD